MTELSVIAVDVLPELLTILAVWFVGVVGEAALQRARRHATAELTGFAVRTLALVLLASAVISVPTRFGWDDPRWFGLEAPAILRALFTVLLGAWFIRRTSRYVQRRVFDAGHPWRSMVIDKVVSYGGASLVVLLVADAIEIDLTALLATAGVVGIAVGWAAQTSLSNVIAGVFLLFDRPFTVGDVIMVEGQIGTVERISLMSTFLRTFDNLIVRWPNEVVLKATITNYAMLPVRRIEVPVRLPADAPSGALVDQLSQALQALDVLLLEPAPEVRLTDLVDGGVSLQARGWVARTDFLEGRDKIILAILETLVDAGVPPRVPIWEVHTKPGDPPLPS